MRNIGTAEGVIGYIYRPGHPDHHKLTMDKDDDDDSNGRVYVAYFKFGSLVATSSQKTVTFTSSDIVAKPSEWTGTVTDWYSVPFVKLTDPNQELMLDGKSLGLVSFAQGTGDPCDYWFGNKDMGSWRLPTKAENADFIGRPGVSSNGVKINNLVYYNWSLTGTASVTNVAIGTFPQSPGGSTTSLPAAGLRSTNGSISSQGSIGHYWSSTAISGSYGYCLLFSDTGTNNAGPTNPYANGFPVRCVR